MWTPRARSRQRGDGSRRPSRRSRPPWLHSGSHGLYTANDSRNRIHSWTMGFGMVLTSLLGDRLAPLTYSIGFLSAPPKRVARAVRWLYFRWPDAWRRVAVLNGGLEEALLQLQPLGGLLHPRVLVASTALEGWSAVFDGDARGQGVRGVSVRLSRALRVPGYFVAAAPPALDPEHFPGFRQFYVLGPQTGRDHVRAVLGERGGGRRPVALRDRRRGPAL